MPLSSNGTSGSILKRNDMTKTKPKKKVFQAWAAMHGENLCRDLYAPFKHCIYQTKEKACVAHPPELIRRVTIIIEFE